MGRRSVHLFAELFGIVVHAFYNKLIAFCFVVYIYTLFILFTLFFEKDSLFSIEAPASPHYC